MTKKRPITYRFATAALVLAAPLALLSCGSDSPSGPTGNPVEITTTALEDAIIGEAYSEGVAASGGDGDYAWEVVGGELPPGLTATVEDVPENDLLITGVPEELGGYTFTVRVEDGAGRSDEAQLTLQVRTVPGGGVIATPVLPPALAGFVYRPVLRTVDTIPDFTWTVVEGTLPAGLELQEDGQFAGTPTSTDTATFTVQASSAQVTGRHTYTLRVLRDQPNGYHITAFPVVDVPAGLQGNLEEAIRRWEAAITGDLAVAMTQIGLFGPDDCGGFGQLSEGAPVDDIMIMVNIDSIDGPGEVLAQAGPCSIRGNGLPVAGLLTLDETDLEAFISQETVTDVIQHEMGHVLGMGTLWTLKELLVGKGGSDPRYTGAEAVAAYRAAGGEDPDIPLETEGGAGTRDSHWREAVFGRELMTGFSSPDGVDMFLSRMSIASLADVGYSVNLEAADSEPLLPFGRIAADAAGDARGARDIAGVGPIRVIPDSVSPRPVPGGTP